MSSQVQERRCAIYARVSTTLGLSQEFNSVDAQIASCKHHINAHAAEGWVLADIYKDEGISGSTTERPDLRRMLEDIRQGKIQQIIVYKIDRLSRNLRAFLDMQALFTEHEASMASVTEPYDTSTYMGRAMLNLLGVFAEMERERIRERICDKIAATCAKGLWKGGCPPYGYSVSGQKLSVIPEFGAIVRTMFEMRAAGAYPKEICAELNGSGRLHYMPTCKKMGHWTMRQVCEILRNPIYAGYIDHKGKRYEGVHERIVPRPVWEEVQKLMDEEAKARTKEKNSTLPFPLRGLLYCGSCGCRMTTTYTRKGGHVHRYYACTVHKSRGSGECACPNLNAQEVERFMRNELAGRIGRDADLAAAIIERMPERDPRLVGDCLFNASRLLDYLDDNEMEGAFQAAFSKVTYNPAESSFTISMK